MLWTQEKHCPHGTARTCAGPEGRWNGSCFYRWIIICSSGYFCSICFPAWFWLCGGEGYVYPNNRKILHLALPDISVEDNITNDRSQRKDGERKSTMSFSRSNEAWSIDKACQVVTRGTLLAAGWHAGSGSRLSGDQRSKFGNQEESPAASIRGAETLTAPMNTNSEHPFCRSHTCCVAFQVLPSLYFVFLICEMG